MLSTRDIDGVQAKVPLFSMLVAMVSIFERSLPLGPRSKDNVTLPGVEGVHVMIYSFPTGSFSSKSGLSMAFPDCA